MREWDYWRYDTYPWKVEQSLHPAIPRIEFCKRTRVNRWSPLHLRFKPSVLVLFEVVWNFQWATTFLAPASPSMGEGLKYCSFGSSLGFAFEGDPGSKCYFRGKVLSLKVLQHWGQWEQWLCVYFLSTRSKGGDKDVCTDRYIENLPCLAVSLAQGKGWEKYLPKISSADSCVPDFIFVRPRIWATERGVAVWP